MKKKAFLAGILTILSVFGVVFVGCDDGSNDSGGSKGTLTLYNSTTYDNDDIVLVELYRGTVIRGTPEVTFNVPIARGSNRSWSLDPGAYVVYVVCSADTNEDYPYTIIINISAGQTTNVTFTGDTLR